MRQAFESACFLLAGWLAAQARPSVAEVLRLGTEYGGWTIVDNPLLRNSWVVLCGAGEDISFDLALQATYQCNIVIVDPTPCAVDHFQGVLSSAQKGTKGSNQQFRRGVLRSGERRPVTGAFPSRCGVDRENQNQVLGAARTIACVSFHHQLSRDEQIYRG